MNGPPDATGFLLWHAGLRWRAALDAGLAPLEMTHTQFFLLGSLRWLTSQGARPSQTELARHAGLDPMVVSQGIRLLAARGLVARDEDPRDTRAFRLSLTRDGEELARRAIAVAQRVDKTFFASVRGAPRDLAEHLRALVVAAGDPPGLLAPPVAAEAARAPAKRPPGRRTPT